VCYPLVETFRKGLTTSRPSNTTALTGVARLSGRMATLGAGAQARANLLALKAIVKAWIAQFSQGAGWPR
jgi:hypothetical protein